MAAEFDLVIVGAGLIGAAAVRHAAVGGQTVAVIGPPEPSDPRSHRGPFASHHDSGRITRHLDASPVWADLAARSIRQYPLIEDVSGIPFHHDVGVLWVDRRSHGLDDLSDAEDRHGVALVPAVPAAGAAPSMWHFPAGHDVRLEPGPAGFIDPRRMRTAQLRAAVGAGAVVIDGVVSVVDPARRHVRLRLVDGRVITASTVIVAAGVYTTALLAELAEVPITPIGVAVAKAEVDGSRLRRWERAPAMIYRRADTDTVDVYAVPPVEYPDGRWYLKLGVELMPEHELDGPDAVNRWMAGDAASWRSSLEGCLHRLLPAESFSAVMIKPCVYARTPHRYPFVDHVADRVVVAAGGNGRAAKSADALGALAVGLATAGEWVDPMDPADFELGAPPGPDSVADGRRPPPDVYLGNDRGIM